MIAAALALVLAASQLEVSVSHRRVVALDGVALALHRYEVRPASSSAPPVLIVADAGFGRALFEPLSRHLARAGRRVYVAELRGQGAADPGFSLRAIIPLDFPAIARAIGEPVDLVAHGYLGALALAASTKELHVRRVVALNTPMTPEDPTSLARRFLEDGGRFSTLGASPEGHDVFTQLFAMRARGDGRLTIVASHGARDLSRSTAAELASWMVLGDLPLDDGTTVLGRLREFDRPTVLLLGLADAWAPPEVCTPLREHSRAKVELRLFTRTAEGDDFAHVSLLTSARAPAVVFPAIEEALR